MGEKENDGESECVTEREPRSETEELAVESIVIE